MPHGNSKSTIGVYNRTKPSVINKIKEKIEHTMPGVAYKVMVSESTSSDNIRHGH